MNEKKKLVFATNNAHKLEEARAILGNDMEIVSLADIGCHEEIPETADTLEGNALIKARWVRDRYGVDCFADDTGLMVDALGGEPGVYSARYAGPGCTPADNIVKLLGRMQGVEERSAHFSTVVALAAGGREHTFEGRVEGRIATACHGSSGFGYDPLFIADETGCSFASMSAEAKNAISHRGRAMRALRDFLTSGALIWLLFLCAPAKALADDWRLHPSYDGQTERIVDTPRHTYFLGTTQTYTRGNPYQGNLTAQLYRYDKQEGVLETLGTQGPVSLSEDFVTSIAYDHQKRYLVISYHNGNVDILHDDGKVDNVPGLLLADGSLAKTINHVNIDPETHRIILATGFGYVVVNPDNLQVDYSRDLNQPVLSAAWFGGKLWLGTEEGIYYGDPKAYSWSDFQRLGNATGVGRLIPVGQKWLFFLSGLSKRPTVRRISIENGDWKEVIASKTAEFSAEPGAEGLAIVSPAEFRWLDSESKSTFTPLPAELQGATGASVDGRDVWFSLGRKGWTQLRVPSDPSGEWKVLVPPMLPNAASGYWCTSMAYHPEFGMLVRNHGYSHAFNPSVYNYWKTPDLISAYKGMDWTPVSTTYRTEMPGLLFDNPIGLAIDPENKDHVYCGSAHSGLLRLDLRNPHKSLHMSKANDMLGGAGQTGFVEILPDDSDVTDWDIGSPFSAPRFDASGGLWTIRINTDPTARDDMEVWYWSPTDRAATTSAADFLPWKKLTIKGANTSYYAELWPLTSAVNSHYVLLYGGALDTPIVLLDHGGTPTSPGDDKSVHIRKLYDQNGTQIKNAYIYCVYEEPATGLVWVGTAEGVYTFRPSEMMQEPGQVRRVLVPRNDGTNLADYLLDGASVYAITSDASGRKWFATNGGLVCTSADGRTVYNTYTTANSGIRGDVVYSMCHNPENNSLMIGTDKGLCEFFITGLSGTSESDVRIYPNPVRPGYFGHVTIDGLADGAMVKIVDTAGRLVKECGQSFAGSITWDITNDLMKRVPGGIYFAVASNGPDSDRYAKIGKILVVE